MNERLFPLTSRIPFTPAWRLYRETNLWMKAAVECLTAAAIAANPDVTVPKVNLPLPRHIPTIVHAVKRLRELLAGVSAALHGNEPLAREFLVRSVPDVESRLP